MSVDGPYPEGPVVSKPLVAPHLMVDPRKHGPQLVRIDQAHDLPHTVGTRLLGPDQSFHPAGLTQLPLHGMEAALPQSEEEEDTAPDSSQGDAGPPAPVLQLADSEPEIKDFLYVPAEAAHHGLLSLARCFSWKNR
jgi:hypothetical protein